LPLVSSSAPRAAEAAGRGDREGIRMMDERFTQAAALFQQASLLLADLTALGARLPDPNFSARIPSAGPRLTAIPTLERPLPSTPRHKRRSATTRARDGQERHPDR